MRKVQPGSTDLEVSATAYGGMSLTDFWPDIWDALKVETE